MLYVLKYVVYSLEDLGIILTLSRAFVSNFFRIGSAWFHLVSDVTCIFMVVDAQFILQNLDMSCRMQYQHAGIMS